MKLDKIKFARLVAYLSRNGFDGYQSNIEAIDDMIDIEVPMPIEHHYPKNDDVERLMALMAEGTHKIEAIKHHRNITGMGLKESKDAVERYWVELNEVNLTKRMLAKLDQQLEVGSDIGYTLKGFSD